MNDSIVLLGFGDLIPTLGFSSGTGPVVLGVTRILFLSGRNDTFLALSGRIDTIRTLSGRPDTTEPETGN